MIRSIGSRKFRMKESLLAADYFAMGKIDAKFISGMKKIAKR